MSIICTIVLCEELFLLWCSMSCIRTKLALANKGSVTTVFRRIIHLAKHDYTQIISQTLSNIWIKYSEDTEIITVRILVNYQKQILMVIIKHLIDLFDEIIVGLLPSGQATTTPDN